MQQLFLVEYVSMFALQAACALPAENELVLVMEKAGWM